MPTMNRKNMSLSVAGDLGLGGMLQQQTDDQIEENKKKVRQQQQQRALFGGVSALLNPFGVANG